MHVDFDETINARNGIFSKDEIDNDMLNEILEGDLEYYDKIIQNILNYYEIKKYYLF